jgi:hypothetical protein
MTLQTKFMAFFDLVLHILAHRKPALFLFMIQQIGYKFCRNPSLVQILHYNVSDGTT